MTVYTAVSGNNSDLIKAAAALYLQDGAIVADVTFGKGVFWRKVDRSSFTLLASDIRETPALKDEGGQTLDFRSLPYDDGSIDIVVLDPPYIHSPGRPIVDSRYGNTETTKGILHDGIMELYQSGMAEAVRVLKREGGQLWVKTKDQVQGGVQRWAHVELYNAALGLGLFGRDLFVLIPSSRTPSGRWKRQIHARKNHSFLWVFEKSRRQG